jgi:hypothetical protein
MSRKPSLKIINSQYVVFTSGGFNICKSMDEALQYIDQTVQNDRIAKQSTRRTQEEYETSTYCGH